MEFYKVLTTVETMKNQPLYEIIYGDLWSDIKMGVYSNGDRVPSEKELSQKYNVSRITSKKALEKLSDQGIITRMPGKGSFVSFQNIIDMKRSVEEKEKEKEKKSTLIGVIMDGFGASFGFEILLGIESECKKHNFSMILKCSHGNKDQETDAINELLALGVAGIIIMCVHEENYNSTVLRLVVEDFPVVAIDRRLKGVPVSFVGTDNEKAARDLTKYLAQRGYKNICFVSHDALDTPTILERQTGFRSYCIEHGILLNDSIKDLKSTLPRSRNDENIKKDKESIRAFIQKNKNVDAFFAVEYEIARIIYRILSELKLESKYPIVCFDGVANILNESQFTHVNQRESEMGIACVNILAKKLNGDKNIDIVLIPYDIIEATTIET